MYEERVNVAGTPRVRFALRSGKDGGTGTSVVAAADRARRTSAAGDAALQGWVSMATATGDEILVLTLKSVEPASDT